MGPTYCSSFHPLYELDKVLFCSSLSLLTLLFPPSPTRLYTRETTGDVSFRLKLAVLANFSSVKRNNLNIDYVARVAAVYVMLQ